MGPKLLKLLAKGSKKLKYITKKEVYCSKSSETVSKLESLASILFRQIEKYLKDDQKHSQNTKKSFFFCRKWKKFQ